MGYATLTTTLLLLIQCGRKGAALTINSNSTGNVLTGQDISLNISYNVASGNPLVSWKINDSLVVQWAIGFIDQSPSYDGRLWIIGNGSLLIANSVKSDTGNYTVTITASGSNPVSHSFQVKIYDPVDKVMVMQSPQSADEKMAVVNLSCSASGDIEQVTWTKNGQALGSNSAYSLQDGNKTLQIKPPDRTSSGNYTCNMSNPVSWEDAPWNLTVSYTDTLSGGAIAGIVIGSVVGAILLILLIVLLVFCIRKRKKEKQKKKKTAETQHKDVLRTVSGNTLSPDDPAYFTMNNIMYRNSSISMGSYNMNYNDSMSEYKTPSPQPPSSKKVKHATQV